MSKLSKAANIFVDFGQGDKFMSEGFDYDDDTNTLVIKVNKASLGWVKMDVMHPITLSSDCTK